MRNQMNHCLTVTFLPYNYFDKLTDSQFCFGFCVCVCFLRCDLTVLPRLVLNSWVPVTLLPQLLPYVAGVTTHHVDTGILCNYAVANVTCKSLSMVPTW